MSLSDNVKNIETAEVVLEIDKVSLYKIKDKPGQSHKPSNWDISNPDWEGKLQIIGAGSNTCEVQFENSNGIFGVSVIKESTSSAVFQKILDRVGSSRYFTLGIQASGVSGGKELFGIGLANANESTRLFKTILDYFATQRKNALAATQDSFVDTSAGKGEISKSVDEIEIVECVSVSAINVVKKLRKFEQMLEYKCSFCTDSFITTDLLKEHMEANHAKEAMAVLFYCDESNCGKRFLSEMTLDNHKVWVHKAAPKKRELESEPEPELDDAGAANGQEEEPGKKKRKRKKLNKFERIKAAKGTSYQEGTSKDLVCHLCPQGIFHPKEENLLLQHWAKVHQITKPITCEACHFIFKGREHLEKHNIHVHFACFVCSTKFGKEKILRRHLLRIHKQTLKYDCQLCKTKTSFVNKDLFTKHMETTHKSK